MSNLMRGRHGYSECDGKGNGYCHHSYRATSKREASAEIDAQLHAADDSGSFDGLSESGTLVTSGPPSVSGDLIVHEDLTEAQSAYFATLRRMNPSPALLAAIERTEKRLAAKRAQR